MTLIHRTLVVVLALTGALPSQSAAQVFLASQAHPDFAVGPLFVIANVRPDRSVTVNLSFSLTLRQGAAPTAMEQDLFLLWPAEVVEPSAPGVADPSLARDIHEGFVVLTSGRLALRRSRARAAGASPRLAIGSWALRSDFASCTSPPSTPRRREEPENFIAKSKEPTTEESTLSKNGRTVRQWPTA